MRNILFVTGLILLLSVTGFSQKNKKSSEVDEPVKSSGANNQKPILLKSGTNFEAQLQSTLDVKKAQVGDEVVLKTTKTIKQNGETIVPKGTNLIGRITEVQQKSKNNGASKIGMIFDRIEGKNLEAPISASIVSILNAGAQANVADTLDSDVTGSTSTSGRASSGGTSSGGLLGGVTNTATQTVGGVKNTAGQTVGITTGTLGRTVNGIQISRSVSGSAQGSSTLSSQDKNLRLEKGATFQLRLNGSLAN